MPPIANPEFAHNLRFFYLSVSHDNGVRAGRLFDVYPYTDNQPKPYATQYDDL